MSDLQKVLERHAKWLRNEGGEQADLRGARLRGAYLRGARLREADLSEADLREADLRGADLSGAYLPDYQICPEVGAFTAFKRTSEGIAVIEIPADAKRTSSLVGRKCRAEFVRVVEGSGFDRYTRQLEYKSGDMVYPDSYDDDIRVECTHGIHFFMTRAEAERW